MTRILVLSDTHGDTGSIRDALPLIRALDPHAICHLGDVMRDVALLRNLVETPVHAVRGNCDFTVAEPLSLEMEFGGVRVFLSHGHEYGVKTGFDALALAAKARGCAVALFGHTHEAHIGREEGVLLVNPGSLARPRGGRRGTMALLMIDNGKAEATLLEA